MTVLPLLTLMSCAKLGELARSVNLDDYTPTVSFKKLDIKKASFEGLETDFVFKVDNPNPVGLSLASLAYDLDIEGSDFAKGNNKDGLSIAAGDSSQVKLPVDFKFADLIDLVSAAKTKDELAWTLKGSMGFDTPLGQLSVPYTKSGELPVLRAPSIKFSSLKVKELSILENKASLELGLALANKGGHALNLGSFDYELALSGSKVASGAVAALASLDGNEATTVKLPIDINLARLGSSLVSAITNRDRVEAALSASLDVETPYGTIPLEVSTSDRLSLQ